MLKQRVILRQLRGLAEPVVLDLGERSHQPRDLLPCVQQILRPTAVVREDHRRVDAKHEIEGGQHTCDR